MGFDTCTALRLVQCGCTRRTLLNLRRRIETNRFQQSTCYKGYLATGGLDTPRTARGYSTTEGLYTFSTCCLMYFDAGMDFSCNFGRQISASEHERQALDVLTFGVYPREK